MEHDDLPPPEDRSAGLDRRMFLKRFGMVAAGSATATWFGGAPDFGRAASASVLGPPGSGTGGYELANNFVRLSGRHGKITELAVDAGGRRRYERTTSTRFHLGQADIYDAVFNNAVRWSREGNALVLTGMSVADPRTIRQRQRNAPTPPLSSGGTYGQSFTVDAEGFSRVGGAFPTYTDRASGMTLTLYRGEPGGPLERITDVTLRGIVDGAYAFLDCPHQPAGTYYLEMSDPVGTPGWWYQDGQVSTDLGGKAYVDREARPTWTMTLEVAAFDIVPAEWRFQLNGPRLETAYTIGSKGSRISDPGLTFVTPWVKDGYSTAYEDGVLFSRFVSETGRYMPIEQLKRQNAWGVAIGGGEAVHATGTGPYDLRLVRDGVEVRGEMTADEMELRVTGRGGDDEELSRSLNLEVQRPAGWLPSFYPAFVASATGRAQQLNRFFYERSFSLPFGLGEADWKDWKGRIADWTDTSAREAEGRSLLRIKQDADGYVWSWSDARGWPFPDRQTYDTRHFTTNSTYVLGAWRYYSWTGDDQFLETMIPRVRRAIAFVRTACDGNSGLLTIPSPDHPGTPQALGSNWWDLLSHGHADAYCNLYYYGALGAAAQLERHLGEEGRAAELESLRELARVRFNQTFWDDEAGRYIQTVDVDGTRHDYGSSYVNLEALTFGLADTDQAARIFGWLDDGHTELSDTVTLIGPAGPVEAVPDGGRLGQSYSTDAPTNAVGAKVRAPGSRTAAFWMTLHADGPNGEVLARKRFERWWDGGWASLEYDERPAGIFHLELSEAEGPVAWEAGHDERDRDAGLPRAITDQNDPSQLQGGTRQGQVFVTDELFDAVGGRFPTWGTTDSSVTLSLHRDGPDGELVAQERFTDVADNAWVTLEFDEPLPAGTYHLEQSEPDGTIGWWSHTDDVYPHGHATRDGAEVAGDRTLRWRSAADWVATTNGEASRSVAARALAAVGPHYEGPADIYSRWAFAPRCTTRRNHFWWSFTWDGAIVPWEQQLQDGGTSLHLSGFDVIARARHRSADDAWARLTAILDRWSEPDHLCGGAPLFRGELPQQSTPGQVGVDQPFPESGLAPAAFLYAFVGVEAEPDALVITPNLPAALDHVGVDNLHWRGRTLKIRANRRRVTVSGDGLEFEQRYEPGSTVRLPATSL